ncbi:hypothetical protein pdul_cds_763 [Pandoravirus dulcis]|uniref:Uncharacterized protein n=1 Tax=Pandoravirus dulcis TaxID=1349409 RepID=S4VRN8_9VIRU|nr:hypothetical protein pdul_cds_763 [Pandoravirus dulcis]AGO82947.2 hypothetical protein pdul_cds_763 [Pandoravirus dulcis]
MPSVPADFAVICVIVAALLATVIRFFISHAGERTTKHGRQKFKQVSVAATSADPQVARITKSINDHGGLYGPPDAEGWDPLPFRKEDERYARSVSERTKPHH